MKTIYQLLSEAIPTSDLHNHESDLYVPVNGTTIRVIRAYICDPETEMHGLPKTFVSEIGAEGLMFDIPLSFDPFWQEVMQ
jgi:hypothetical protein